MEYNFSLFFGLAVQVYEATLVSDDTPFDRFLRDPANAPLSPAAERGRQVFFNVNAGARRRAATAPSATPARSSARPRSTRWRPAGWSASRAGQLSDTRDAQHRRPGDDRRPRQRRPRPVRDVAVGRGSRRAAGVGRRRRRHLQDPRPPQRRAHRAVLPQRRRGDAPRRGQLLRPRRQPGRRVEPDPSRATARSSAGSRS